MLNPCKAKTLQQAREALEILAICVAGGTSELQLWQDAADDLLRCAKKLHKQLEAAKG